MSYTYLFCVYKQDTLIWNEMKLKMQIGYIILMIIHRIE